MTEFAGVEPEGLMNIGADDQETMPSGFMTVIGMGGGTSTITFTVTLEMVGEWGFGCFLDLGTHYAAGMHGTLLVTG